MKRALRSLSALVLILGLAWAWASRPADGRPDAVVGPRVGALAPLFTLQGSDGAPVALESLRGRPVVLNFWATWCPPCRVEMPALDALAKDHAGDGLVVLAVNQLEDGARVAQFMRENGLSLHAALDTSGEVNRAYGVRGLPTTYFIDRDGVIRDVVYGGPMVKPLIESKILPLLR